MANVVKLKRGSGSDPSASDMVVGEPVIRTDTAELFFKKDDGSVAKVSGGGGGPDFKYLALRNAANNGAASFPGNDFTLVTSGTTNAITPAAANTLLVSVNGVIQKPNTGTSTSGITGFIVDGSRFKTATNLSAAPDFILYQESGGIGEPSDNTVSEAKLNVSNSPVNGYFLSAQSGNTGGLTWAAPVATSCTGNSATATSLATARAINGVNFDGTAAITVTAAAGTLSGNTLNSSVVTSSLTSLGDLAGLTVNGDATFTGANYNLLWDKSDNALEFADNAKAVFGTGSDLQIYHNGSYSKVEDSSSSGLILRNDASADIFIQTDADVRIGKTGSSEYYIYAKNDAAVELYYDNSKKFETTSTGAFITRELEIEGTAVNDFESGRIRFTENAHGFLGGYVHYDGNANVFYIGVHPTNDSTVGNDVNAIKINRVSSDLNVELNYGGSKKFETTSAGVSVSGNLVCGTVTLSGGGLALADNDKVVCGNGDDLQIYHDGSHNIINGATGQNLEIQTNAFRLRNQADSESMIVADADGAVELYHNNSRKLETQSYGVKFDQDTKHLDNGIAYFGTSGDLQIYHDGSKNYLKSAAFTNTEIWSDTFFVKSVTGAGEAIIKGSANGAVELYYDNSKKFETASFGVQFAEDVQFSSPGDNNALTWDKSEFTLEWRDNVKASWGDSKDLQIYHNGSESYILNTGSNLNLGTTSGNNTQIYGNNTVRWLFTYDGHFLPSANNSYDIGSTSLRIRNIYTNDLNLSNEGSSNDVDGTWGSYTIQEGAEDLFLVNKRNGKKYKFALTEVS